MGQDEQNARQGDAPSNADKLAGMLTFDPIKRVPLAGEAFSKVVEEIKKERVEEGTKQAKELLLKAMDFQKQKVDAKKRFEQQDKKFDKELGKILRQIDNLLQGKPQEDNNQGGEEKSEQA